ncbi:cadherin domain-containing protein [uncultured Fibrobacter sp.]|uniref:cadherin repeat domain-containing protein n=1 Tax=uncultured Fibrobacter sp. TaxID=261512 RepID=UPI002805DD8A|nr:cadherin domain-containing protein [uncultured Fibrobacter sp.]
MVKKTWKIWVLGLALLVCGASAETTFDKTVFPLRFYSVENPENADLQLAAWNLLVKYKLFARGVEGEGIVFKGQNVFITDSVGYSGSATGGFQMGGNTRHFLGGPALFGGIFSNGDGLDTLTGPVRFLKSFDVSRNGSNQNAFYGNLCLDGGYNGYTEVGVKGRILTSEECQSTDLVPAVDTTLDVPTLDSNVQKTTVYHSPLSATNSQTSYIHVPPYSATDSNSFNYFVQSINFSNNGKLVVVMPPGGRLTKIFVKESIVGLGGTDNNDVTVAEALSLEDWNAADSSWNTERISGVANSDYQGNLLFYTPKDLDFGAGQKSLQGTFISGGSINFAQHTNFAGQLLAKVIYIDADFSAKDFRYVPFDPPVLDIDPTASGGGIFLENNTLQSVQITLSELPITKVTFNYCFVLSNLADSNSSLLANASDFETTGMPICQVSGGVVNGDYGIVEFEAGSISPTKSATVTPKADGRIEGNETFKLYVFNMSGAVLAGNKRSGYFSLTIKDADFNVAPVFDKSSYEFTVSENNSVGDSVGVVHATDKQAEDVPHYYIASGDTSLFALDEETGKITLKKTLDYESKKIEYTIYVYATDGSLNSDTIPVVIRVQDINEKPTAVDTSFTVLETAAKGFAFGVILASDPDTLNKAKFGNLTYKLLNETATFAIDSKSGKFTLNSALNYETKNSYTVLVEVSDAGGLKDTAKVVVRVQDVNEKPTVRDTAFTVLETAAKGFTFGVILASDPDISTSSFGTLSYKLLNETATFAINSKSGKFTLNSALDYETKNSYTVLVEVSDVGGLKDTAKVVVRVQDVNEKPTARDTVFSVAENAEKGKTLGRVEASDPDILTPAFGTISYKVLTETSVFAVDAQTGIVTLKGSLDYETKNSYMVLILVSDGELSDTATVTVLVQNVNEKPVIQDVTVSIDEECRGCAASTNVSAADPDGDPLHFSVQKDTSGLFQIDSVTGKISLKKDEILDYEKDSVYSISVVVSDPDGLKDTASVTIRVRNILETVEITYAESGDSSWVKPDTIYTNNPKTYIKWTTPSGELDSTIVVDEGKNVVNVSYQDGSAQVVIFLSTKIPEVSVSASNDKTGDPSGVTIVELKDADDTASYIRSNTALVTVVVSDSSEGKVVQSESSFKVELGTATVTKSQIETAEKTVGKVILVDESDLSPSVPVNHSVVGEDRIQVSYWDTTSNGTIVKVSYWTDADGKRLVDENGEEFYEVAYTYKGADGKQVTLSYTVDALGTVKTDSDGNVLYSVSYTKTAIDADAHSSYEVVISYQINSKGVHVTDSDGNMIYNVAYTFTNSYGNSATATTAIIVDTNPPKVKILSPENLLVTSNVSVAVKWVVNDIEQDTLQYQGLNEGKNLIVRTYRDKAGNETSDTVVVILKAGKLINVEMENTLVSSDPKRVDKFTAASNSEPGTSFALSVVNVKTGKEEETQAGSKGGVSPGSFKEPYEGLSGEHLGSTLHITAQAPAVDQTGTSSTLSSILENGYVSLDSGGGWDRKKIEVHDFIENHCSVDFQKAYDSLGAAASLYTTTIHLRIWFFTTLGDYVSDYSFKQNISTEHIDATGGIQLYFELKPDEEGYLKAQDGRKLGTGTYIYKSDVKIRSVLQCDLPDLKRGSIRRDDDNILTKWGYRRPDVK